VWQTLTSPTANSIVHRIAGSTDPVLSQAAQAYWGGIFRSTATVVERAQQRGQAAPGIDPVSAVETLLAPLYLRLLVTHQPVSTAVLTDLVDRTMRLLSPPGGLR
jgi:hypothetical protein